MYVNDNIGTFLGSFLDFNGLKNTIFKDVNFGDYNMTEELKERIKEWNKNNNSFYLLGYDNRGLMKEHHPENWIWALSVRTTEKEISDDEIKQSEILFSLNVSKLENEFKSHYKELGQKEKCIIGIYGIKL